MFVLYGTMTKTKTGLHLVPGAKHLDVALSDMYNHACIENTFCWAGRHSSRPEIRNSTLKDLAVDISQE